MIRFYNNGTKKEVQNMFTTRQQTRFQHGVLLRAPLRRLHRFAGMRIIRRCARVLDRVLDGVQCGTVAPHCDFHSTKLFYPLNKGTPNDFSSRVCAPLPAPAQRGAIVLTLKNQIL